MRRQAKSYQANSGLDLQDAVKQYTPLVRRLAFQIASKLPANVAVDDLVQEGMLGLLDALNRYQPNPGLNFEAYARFRIAGAIYDSCRENDVLSRNQRDKLDDVGKAIQKLEQEFGRAPTEQEIAQACELSIDDYHKTLDTMVGTTPIDDVPEHLLPSSSEIDPSQILSLKQLTHNIADLIKSLPEKERMVVALHYQDDLSFREVAYVMDLTPGRISQIHTQAMVRLRAQLSKNKSLSLAG